MDREEGIKLCQTLLKLAHIIPVDGEMCTTQNTDAITTVSFLDSKQAVYKFVIYFIVCCYTNYVDKANQHSDMSDIPRGLLCTESPKTAK